MKEQSDSNLADVGTDSKPFVAVIKPDGSTDGLVMFRISDVENVIWGFKENWENYDD